MKAKRMSPVRGWAVVDGAGRLVSENAGPCGTFGIFDERPDGISNRLDGERLARVEVREIHPKPRRAARKKP